MPAGRRQEVRPCDGWMERGQRADHMRLAVVAILRGGRARRGHGDTIPFPDLYRSCHTLPPGIGFAELWVERRSSPLWGHFEKEEVKSHAIWPSELDNAV